MSESTGMILDGAFQTEAVDSSAEVLRIAGADISSFNDGTGHLNWEHLGAGEDKVPGAEVVGKVLSAKKIYKESDCSNDRERFFWDQIRLPFIYGVGRLYDGAGHAAAQHIAAIIRDSHANGETVSVGFSIEGSTLKRKGQELLETCARRVAITLKPCNKTQVLGLVSDPNAPKGFEKSPQKVDVAAMVDAKKSEDPMYQRLGGHSLDYTPAMLKALSAGSTNAAPGTLTGGAALQVEDRTLKAQLHAAYRDWNRVSDFRKFLKTRLPEASEEFLNHFADIVDNHVLKLKKAAETVATLEKAGLLGRIRAKDVGLLTPAEKPSELTVQGKPVPLPKEGKGMVFVPSSGTLYTAKGHFQASTPSNPHPHLVEHLKSKGIDPAIVGPAFKEALASSRDIHLRAMRNWFRVNDRFVRGEIPSPVVAHAVAFAMMSPANPVPLQEVMYGHFRDAAANQGLDVPETPEQLKAVGKDWMSRNRKPEWPASSRDHFLELERHLRATQLTPEGRWTNPVHTKAGGWVGFSKPSKVLEYFGGYLADHHKDVVQAIRDSRGDARAVARRLTEVRGIAPKLARYVTGMLGGGNIVVPDTHFLRHYFGTRPVAPGETVSPDTESQFWIKQNVLGKAGSNDVLDGIDEHYFQNHDAVQHVLNDPAMGPYFRGREEQAIFPAFWAHWLSIPGHEKAIGTPNEDATNTTTDHMPFWDAVEPHLKSEQGYDPELPIRTAAQHHRWIEDYGGARALGLYYEYLVPKLLANEARGREEVMRKAQEVQVELLGRLRKAEEPYLDSDQTVEYQGRRVIPGSLNTQDGKMFHILAAHPTEFHVVPDGTLNSWQPDDVQRIPRQRGKQDWNVLSFPQTQDGSQVVDGQKHGDADLLHHEDVRSWVHGFDFGAPKQWADKGINRDVSYWSQHNGQPVYVKGNKVANEGQGRFSDVDREALYHNLARDVFGLGEYMPKVAAVVHPQTGARHVVIEGAEGQHFYDWTRHHYKALKDLAERGELDKLGLMNMVLGNRDRHGNNYLMTKDGKLKLIDHGLTFLPDTMGRGGHPHYREIYWEGRGKEDGYTSVHPDAAAWIQKVDPTSLEQEMRRQNVPSGIIQRTRNRLRVLQMALQGNPKTLYKDLYDYAQKGGLRDRIE